MNNYSSLIYFVEGATTPAEFATWLYKNPEAEALLTQEEDLPKHAQSFQNLYLYLISLDLESPASLLDAQAVIASTLNKYGLPFRRSDAPLKNFDALLKAQPKWLDLPSKYAAELMESMHSLSGKALIARLKLKIAEDFKYLHAPPKWLQSPQWVFQDGRPLIFVGQLDVTPLHHDTSAAFVFYNESKATFVTVVQSQ